MRAESSSQHAKRSAGFAQAENNEGLRACSVASDTFATPWTIACQAPLPVGFPRQEYWNGLPLSSPGNIPAPGMEPTSPALAGGVGWVVLYH